MTKVETFGDNALIPYSEILPAKFVGYLDEIHNATGFDRNYLLGCMLSAVACAMQKKFMVQSYEQYPALYMCLVGRSGKAKTPPLKAIYSVLDVHNLNLCKEYRKLKKDLEKEIASFQALPAKEKKGATAPNLDLPQNPKFIIEDATPEMVVSLLDSNWGSQTLRMNELAGLLDNTNRYNTNSEAFYLTAYDQTNYSYDRKNGDSFIIHKATLNIVGTIQTDLLSKFKENNRDTSGLLFRFLFVFPENDFMQTDVHLTPKNGNLNPYCGWNESIQRILNLRSELDSFGEIQPRIITLSSEAEALLTQWAFDNRSAVNELIAKGENPNTESGFVAKSIYTALRIALILEVMRNVDCLDQSFTISGDSALGAILATDAFTDNGLYVYAKTQDQNAVRPKKEVKAESLLDHLEIGVTYVASELRSTLEGKGMKKSTFYNLLPDLEKDGFIKREHGKITRTK